MRGLCIGMTLVLLGACGTGDDRSDGNAEGTEAAVEAQGKAPSPPVAGELPSAQPVVAQIFDEQAEPEAPRRVTYHALVAHDASRDQLRETLSRLIEEQVEADPRIVAARAIGYYGVQTSATEAEMVAFVWAEWLPIEGWYGATEASAESIHRLYFYPETPPQW